MRYFVSYTTRDQSISLDFLNKLHNILSNYGKVYIDLLHNDSIDKQKRVMSELEKCDEIILIETESVFKSNWVKIEIEKAQKLEKIIHRFSHSELLQLIENKENFVNLKVKKIKAIC